MAQPKLSSKEFFSKLSVSTMELVDEFYDDKVTFQDPLGVHKGSAAVKEYYANLYKNVESIRFEYTNQVVSGNDEVLFWTMYLKTKGLNGGREFSVDGNSHFSYSPVSQKCIFHRDYFDMGEFIYEKVPVLKNIIGFLKNRLKKT